MDKNTFGNLSVTLRVMLAVLTVLFVALTCTTVFLTTFVKGKMTGIATESVDTLFSSLQNGVEDSLERGQMKNFEKLLVRQKSIPGVLDVSLYDRKGEINLSSSGTGHDSARKLDRQVHQRILSQKGAMRVEEGDSIRIFAPQLVKADCIRCHPTWKQGEVGGILSLTYDLTKLHATLTNLQLILLGGSLLLLALVSTIILVMRRVVRKPIDRIIEELTGSSSLIATVSQKAAAASQSLAENASEQAASLEQTSASLEEIASMTANNAENATSADDLMREGNRVMTDANERMHSLTTAMQEISQANAETTKIIKTIEDVAFQTNLLALNAAVEAARAGEAGAGFAVVADEVRNLARRAAQAAQDTTQLLAGTSDRVNAGVDLVQVTNEAFEMAAEKAQQTAALLNEIATASKEQTIGINQVATAVTELDKVTQQNAADADQAAHIAEEMEAQSDHLNHDVSSLVRLVRGSGDKGERRREKEESNRQQLLE